LKPSRSPPVIYRQPFISLCDKNKGTFCIVQVDYVNESELESEGFQRASPYEFGGLLKGGSCKAIITIVSSSSWNNT
jgi:hypothetical protein